MSINRRNWIARLVVGAALVFAAWSFALLYEGFIAQGYSSALVFPFTDAAAAKRAYDALSGSAPLAARDAAARRLVDADPANPSSWNAVSFVEHLRAGKMSPAAVAALDRSYTLSFFDRHETLWRVSYALENWEALPPELREQASAEARAALRDSALGPKLRGELGNIRDPAGRLAASFILAETQAPSSGAQ